jgi:hypothetical protein
MIVNRISNNEFSVAVTTDELIALGNCLNEVCNGIELFEFETRVGASREEVARMLDKILVARQVTRGGLAPRRDPPL